MSPRLTELARSLRNALGVRLSTAEAPSWRSVIALGLLAAAAMSVWSLAKHPPLVAVEPGAVAVRTNQLSGSLDTFGDGSVWVLPVAQVARTLPPDIGRDVVEPTVQGVVYRVFSAYTVGEIFSSKRSEIQQAIEAELKTQLGSVGLVVKGVQFGQVDLPAEYRAGLDRMLAEELEADKMRYTLKLKEKRVKQRKLEAQAEKVARLRQAEGSSQARQIEAAGEAASRQKLADAEAYRLDRVGKANSEQMAREGALISKHPLLIQKTVADKLSDKVQVIIAPPGTGGRFIAANLLGGGNAEAAKAATAGEGQQ